MALDHQSGRFGLRTLSHRQTGGQRGLKASDGDGYRRFATLLRSEGILLPREPGRAAFVSSTHGGKDVEETLAACEKVLLHLHQEDPT